MNVRISSLICWTDNQQRQSAGDKQLDCRELMSRPMATCIAMNPRDLNIILIGYEGGIVAYNVQKATVEKQFEMFLPPGAPGGGSYQDADGVCPYLCSLYLAHLSHYGPNAHPASAVSPGAPTDSCLPWAIQMAV